MSHVGFFCKCVFCSLVPLHMFKTFNHVNILILIILLNYVEITMFGVCFTKYSYVTSVELMRLLAANFLSICLKRINV